MERKFEGWLGVSLLGESGKYGIAVSILLGCRNLKFTHWYALGVIS